MAFVNPLSAVRSGRVQLRLAFLAAGFSGALLTTLCVLFDPRWETNDDVAMSMVAHGYGIAAVASPNLVFSNVIWGYLVRLLPSMGGVLGYSIATLLVLYVSSFSIFYFMGKLGIAPWTSFLIACAVLCRPILFPQFTLNAGLLAGASMLALMAYCETRSVLSMIAAAFLLTIAYLIRSQEVGLVLFVALPVMWSRRLHRDRFALRVGAIVLLVIAGAGIWDHFCYSGPAWRHFAALDASRAPFTDFAIAQKIADDPQILSHFRYSRNDVELLGRFFFVDPKIFKPDTLRAMVSSVGTTHFFAGNANAAMDSIRSLLAPEILPIVVLAAITFVLAPSADLLGSWLLFLLALVVMGLFGRGGLLRVDMPIVSLLCLLSIANVSGRSRVGLAKAISSRWRAERLIVACMAATALGTSMYVLLPQARQASQHIAEVQAAAERFPSQIVVAWGAGLEFESLFPLLGDSAKLRSMKIFPLGVFTFAPFSVGAVQEASGRGFVTRIRSADGLLMLATPNVRLLDVWCRERFGGVLKGKILQAAPYVQVDRYWCADR